MKITHYPNFTPITLDLQDELDPFFQSLHDGVSEFSFPGIYLFRATYGYEVALLEKDKLILKGAKEGKNFYALPMGFPEDRGTVKKILEESDYIKGLSESNAEHMRVWLEQHGYEVCEDRDNFDYLYSREELASLSGKRFHKKRNLVNAFQISHPNHRGADLTPENKKDAYAILEEWMIGRDDFGDYQASKEALDLQERLGLTGYIVYVDDHPAAYTMGEGISQEKMYVIHIEKGLQQYKGIYQYINQVFAQVLPENYSVLNREQDLGDLGLRQAKMTYRPIGFTKKYRVCKEELIKVPFHTRACDAKSE